MPGKRAPKSNIPTLRPPTFDVDDNENWMNFLNSEGFVVLHEAITKEQLLKIIQ